MKNSIKRDGFRDVVLAPCRTNMRLIEPHICQVALRGLQTQVRPMGGLRLACLPLATPSRRCGLGLF